jgi:cytochrome c2
MHIITRRSDSFSTARSVGILPVVNFEPPRRFISYAVRGLAVLSLAVGGCGQSSVHASRNGGNSEAGVALIQKFGCGTCHTIPGIADADGQVGPPLTAIARRVYLAGKLRNTPDNMVRWLKDPQAVVAGNAMPDMGISQDQARDITAYLYTLQ